MHFIRLQPVANPGAAEVVSLGHDVVGGCDARVALLKQGLRRLSELDIQMTWSAGQPEPHRQILPVG